LINQGQHDLDLMCYLAGRPSRVVGWTRTRLHAIETEDTAVASLEWPNGAVGSVHLSTVEADESQRIEITGTAGRLRLLHGRLEICRNEVDFREYAASPGDPYASPATEQLPVVEGAPVTHLNLYVDLQRTLAGRGPPMVPASEALVALEVANAITYSSHTRTEVELPLDRTAYRDLLNSLRDRVGAR